MKTSSPNLAQQIRDSLTTKWLGRTIHFYDAVESTNLIAIELAQEGEAEGTVVLADQQLGGRGRGDRSWHSPAGVGIYCSVLLRPKMVPAKGQLITLMAGVSIVKAITLKTGLSPRVKWPNDILINDKKVAGILLESKVSGEQIGYSVLGFGINVNNGSADFPQGMEFNASSLFLELNRLVDRSTLIIEVFAELERLYHQLQGEDFLEVLEQWRYYSSTLGQRVRIWQKDRATEGIAVDLAEDGGLLVRAEGGKQIVVHAGDVEHLSIL
ncbi:MAG: biotin--[acetyl-CoA-carboxylase] ligase [Deltaproteobacteria bacterium]|nr:MAG: biotin--[acetyl-CoA-carboxylase] ligase [Deltaproteobacteria bacterium]